MCHTLDESKSFQAPAYFRKGNLPGDTAYWFSGVVIPCQCGAKAFFRAEGKSELIEGQLETEYKQREEPQREALERVKPKI